MVASPWRYVAVLWCGLSVWRRPLLSGADDRLLEPQAQSKLNRARRVRLRSNGCERRATGVVVRSAEAYVVKRVEELRCELEVHAFRNLVTLRDREIPVVHVIHANGIDVSWLVAKPHLRSEERRVGKECRSR